MLTKTCTACGTEKPLEEFHIAPTGKYGRNSKCGVCKNARSRAAYAEDPTHKQRQNAEWKANNKERMAFLVSRWEKQNRDKRNARLADRRAQKLKATPSWIDHEEVRYIYSLAKERGLHCDRDWETGIEPQIWATIRS